MAVHARTLEIYRKLGIAERALELGRPVLVSRSADSAFKFSFTVQGYTLTYSGTIEGETVNGDIEVAGVTGKFSGKRA